MPSIGSRSNPKIKLARSLRQRKAREQERKFLVEGTFHIGAALEAGAALEFVLYAPELLRGDFAPKLIAQFAKQGVEHYEVPNEIIADLSDKENPQGMLAVASTPELKLADMQPAPLSVAIVAPQDPGNLGSILRSMDAAGASGLLLLDGGVDPYHPSALRAGMGAHFWQPVVQANFAEFKKYAQQHGAHLYGSSAHAATDYRGADYKTPAILLLGSEREGLSKEQLAACEQVVKMPMRGKVTSLNLSVAAGILLYAMAEKIGS
jgi:TrmH family RNA methyltransferase